MPPSSSTHFSFLFPFLLLVWITTSSTLASPTSTFHSESAKENAGTCVRNPGFPYRLPKSVAPIAYDLSFVLPSPNRFFNLIQGWVTVDLAVLQPTTCIIIHAHLLNFSASDVSIELDPSGRTLQSSSVTFEVDKQWAVISFDETLPVGNATLNIALYTGSFNTQVAQGLFLSDNSFQPQRIEKDGVRRLLKAWHQGKSKHARQTRRTHHEISGSGASSSVSSTSSPSSSFDYHDSPNYLKRKIAAARTPFEARQCTGKGRGRKSEGRPRLIGEPVGEVFGQGQKMYATQFEVSQARRAFPCFDEPELKAYFRASITVPSDDDLTVLFNTRESSRSVSQGLLTVKFEQSPHRMSSYLVALSVGQFDYVEQIGDGGVRFRIYTPKGASQYGKFALNVTVGVIDYFGSLWKLPYSTMNPKMDQISVPLIQEDAMENWGLLTYWPNFLLVDSDPGKHTLEQLQMVAQVTVHELSHQWFGDSITFPFWDQCFLNEGFARFLQYVGTDYLFPQWNIYTDAQFSPFFDFAYASSMQEDFMGLAGSVVHAPSPLDGNATFDSSSCNNIVYGKGASINRFYSLFLGSDLWNQGLAEEVNRHLWSNPSLDNLIATFASVGAERSDDFKDWLTRPGFPVVEASVSQGVLTLTQKPVSRYLADKSPWWLYFHVRLTNVHTNQSDIATYDTTATSISAAVPAGDYFIETNFNHTMFAVAQYDDSQWPLIFAQASNSNYASIERELLLNSVFILVQMSHENFSRGLQFTNAMGSLLAQLINGTSDQQAYATSLVGSLMSNWFSVGAVVQESPRAFGRLGLGLLDSLWLPTDLSISTWAIKNPGLDQLRQTLWFWGAYYGFNATYLPIVSGSIGLYFSGEPIPDALKAGVFLAVACYGGERGYNAILDQYKQTPASSTDRPLLLTALLTNPQFCDQTYQLIDSDPTLSLSDKLATASSMLGYNSACRPGSWKYYKQLAGQVWARQGSAATQPIIDGFKGYLATPGYMLDAKGFLQANRRFMLDPETTIGNTLTQIQINIDLLNTNHY